MPRSVALALVLLLVAAAEAMAASPQYNYVLHCVGCHTFEGVSPPLGRIPPLKNVVGHFTRNETARRYVANVPGIKNSGLSPDDTAALVNWLIETYAGDSRPQSWQPFSGAEIVALRKDPPGDVIRLRAAAREALAAQGHDIGYYP